MSSISAAKPATRRKPWTPFVSLPFDENGEFQLTPSGGTGELQKLAVRGAGATLLSGGFMLTVQMGSAYVLARILSPSDFGLVAMVTTFSLLLMNFGVNGLTEAVVQRECMNHRLATNLFWINVTGSLLLSVGFAESGRLLASFYHDARIVSVAGTMSMTIVLTGLSVMHIALLKRSMRFAAVSANDSIARLVSVAIAIALGWMGFGYWALVIAAISLPVSTCMGAWMLCRWLPGMPRRAVGTRPVVSFAMSAYARYSTGYLANNLDNLLVGWRLGATSLGFYKRAYDLFILPAGQLSTGLTGVAVAALSRLQSDPARLRQSVLRALSLMALVGMGLGAVLTLAGQDLVLILLGPKWTESGKLFTLFGPGIGVMLLYFTHVWIHLSIGRADRWFRWGLVDLLVTSLALVTGLRWGAEGIALAWVASYWIITLPALWYAGQPIKLSVKAILTVVWRPTVASLVAGAATWLAQNWLLRPEIFLLTLPLFRLITLSVVCCGMYFAAVVVLYGSRQPWTDMGTLFQQIRHRHSATQADEKAEMAALTNSYES